MNFFRKLSLSVAAGIALLAPLYVFAQGTTDYRQGIQSQASAFLGKNGLGYANGATPVDIRYVVSNLITYALGVVGTIFFAYTVYAGYKIMMARGDEEKMNIGKDTLRRSTLGLIIILSSYALTVLVSQIYNYTFPPERTYVDFNVNVQPYDQYGNPDPLR
jgi:hypothetical protein